MTRIRSSPKIHVRFLLAEQLKLITMVLFGSRKLKETRHPISGTSEMCSYIAEENILARFSVLLIDLDSTRA
jgi:hypothetical protein